LLAFAETATATRRNGSAAPGTEENEAHDPGRFGSFFGGCALGMIVMGLGFGSGFRPGI
jgi:hypothetical protein